VHLHLETNGNDHLSTVVAALAASGFPASMGRDDGDLRAEALETRT
jgi:hypothetical protein